MGVTRSATRAVGLSITARPLGGAFSPLSLFAAGEQGAWYDPSDLSTLYQDAAGTTPVTAVGQPVGLMLDKSGRNNHASQSTTTARPTLQQDSGGRYYLSFDGVDDYLKAASLPGSLPLWMAMPVNRATNIFSVCAATGNGMRFETASNGAMRTNNYGSIGSVGTGQIAAVGTTFVQGGYADTGQIGAFVDAGATSTLSTTPLTGTAGLWIGSNETATYFMQGRIYGGVFVQRLLSADEKTNAVRYLAARAGVTL